MHACDRELVRACVTACVDGCVRAEHGCVAMYVLASVLSCVCARAYMLNMGKQRGTTT